eukprot:scaffold45733_cov19-Tisochrysis_lutea.AAC.1
MDSKWQGSFFYVPFPVHCVPHLLRQKWQVVKDLLLKARPAEPFLNKAYVDKLCALPCTSRMFEIDLKAVVYSTHLHTYTSLTCLMSVYAVEHSRCLFMQVSKPAAMLFMCQIMHCTFVRVQIFRLSLYDETKIANALNQVHKENSSSGVNVGSYPVRTYRSRMYRSQSYYVLSNKCLQQATVSDQTDGAKILVSLDCKKQDALEGASARMRELLPPGSIISEQQDVRSLDMRARHLVEKKNSH